MTEPAARKAAIAHHCAYPPDMVLGSGLCVSRKQITVKDVLDRIASYDRHSSTLPAIDDHFLSRLQDDLKDNPNIPWYDLVDALLEERFDE